MVPVRVHLEGFLSYREPAVLDFSDRNLWLLWGRNGVGKSTVFDAITFALFGEGRFSEGNGKIEDYLNHGCSDMSVAFDFDLGEKRYRVKRTAGRRTTFQVFTLDTRQNDNATPIPGTHTSAGLKSWIDTNFPLDSFTFGAAAMLKQGGAEVLLSANAAQRRQFMSKVVNLRSYINLQAEVNVRANRLKAEVATIRSKHTDLGNKGRALVQKTRQVFGLSETEFPDAPLWTGIGKLRIRLAEIGAESVTEVANLEATRDFLIGLTAPGGPLEKQAAAITERAGLAHESVAFADLLKRADEIERCAARLVLLTAVEKPALVFVTARTAFQKADRAAGEAAETIDTAKREISRLTTEFPKHERTVETARETLDKAQIVLAGAKAHRDQIKNRLKLLDANDGKAECAACGLPLTATHVAEERERLEAALKTATTAVTDAEGTATRCREALRNAEALLTALQSALQRESARLSQAKADFQIAEERRDVAQENAAAACQTFAGIMGASDAASWVPTLVLLAAENLAMVDKLSPQFHTVLLTGETPTAGSEPTSDLSILQAEIKSLAGADLEKIRVDEARLKHEKMGGRIVVLDSEMQSVDERLEPADGDTVRLAAERARLKGFREIVRLSLLSETEHLVQTTPGSSEASAVLQQVRTQAKKVLEQARLALANVREEETEVRQRGETARAHDQFFAGFESENATLVLLLREKQQQYLLHETLARKLHSDLLQAVLRDRAETIIVTNADVILQRLSGGTLRVERTGGSSDALDLSVRDHEKGDRSMRPAALSGSQKFRLAVALALGIGQYAAGGSAGGVESVIVDEGFGSLDREGREKMIEELNRLASILKRVIIVSHQEEFENAFPNQWHVVLEGNTARAVLQG